jgi:hypothetical protein
LKVDLDISPHAVHLQIYSYNDLMGKAVRKSLGPLAGPLEFFAREAANRLLLVQGFIHSAHSSEIAVTLRRDPAVGVDRIQLEPVINPGSGEGHPARRAKNLQTFIEARCRAARADATDCSAGPQLPLGWHVSDARQALRF